MNTLLRIGLVLTMPIVLQPLLAGDGKTVKGSQDSGITQEQAKQMLEELQQIHRLLERQKEASPPSKPVVKTSGRVTLGLKGAEMLGSKDAPLTIVEFVDYQCPFCQQFHTATFHEVVKNYIETGKARFYVWDLPLAYVHPNAIRAAQAAHCAGEQGQSWKLRDIMGERPDKLDFDSLVADAASLKMDILEFRTCLESEQYRTAVEDSVLEARKMGVTGTPAFVIGKSTPEGVDGEMFVGSLLYTEFDTKLRAVQGK